MSELVFAPQESFADHFITDANEIIENRSIMPMDIRYHVDHGGRGSAKTWTWADAVVVEAALRPIRVLVTRELQNSIDESIKDEIEAAIINRGWQHFFDMQEKVTKGLNGSRFIYKGLKNNINNIKSISNVDVVLCEEAENISKNSWEKLLPSIRPKSGRPPVVIVIFNPANELDDTYQRFVVTPPPKTLVKQVNYYDNKYFPDHLEEQRAHAERTLPPKDYRHIWLGEPKGSGDDVIIQLDWIKAARFASKDPRWVNVGEKVAGYDPAGQGRDFHAVSVREGNRLTHCEEWLRSTDLREGTRHALDIGDDYEVDMFRYDECGGFGDGVAVFVEDATFDDGEGYSRDYDADGYQLPTMCVGDVMPFNAGDGVVDSDVVIFGTRKTNGETYSNAKAQAHGVTAQLLYNTYRFIEFGEDVEPEDMLSIDIEDNQLFNKIAKELSTPIWVKSEANSKKKVEAKKDMEKRAGLASPNIADSIHMTVAPFERDKRGFLDAHMAKKLAEKRQGGKAVVTSRSKRTGSKTRRGRGTGKGLGGFYG